MFIYHKRNLIFDKEAIFMGRLNFLGLAYTAGVSNLTKLARPYKLNFSITYKCQSRCLTCNIWQMKPSNELTIEEIETFARINNFFKWIELTGGEPFLRSDIVEIASAFQKNSKGLYLLTMPTNSLCNPDSVISKIEEMLDLGIPKLSITVSLDGYRALHDKIRGVSGNYDRAIEMFKRISEIRRRRRNLYAVFGYTMTNYNLGEFSKTYSEVKKEIPSISYNDFHLNLGQVSDIYYSNSGMSLRPPKERAAEEIRNAMASRKAKISAIDIIERSFLKNLHEYVISGAQPMKSRSLDASLFMDSYGNVYPSIMWGRKIGNIREVDYDLMDIWHNKEAEEVRKDISEGREPSSWTACEAYQAIAGNIRKAFL